MALKSFKRVFDSDKPYLVLTVEGDGNSYDNLIIIQSDKTETEIAKLAAGEELKKSLKASAADLIYDLSAVNDCKDRKKGFIFKDAVDSKEVYVNASNTIIYGNVEVLGVDIKALYISADKRLIGKGDVDSSRIKNESIQSALEFANIDGLKGELGCDANGIGKYNFYYLNLENTVNQDDVTNARTAWKSAEKIVTDAKAAGKTQDPAERDKALKKYLSMAKAYLRITEEKKIPADINNAQKAVTEAENEIIKNNIQNEDSFLESLGIRFKKASLIHYEAQDVNKDLNALLKELNGKIKENDTLLLKEDK